MTDIPCTGFDAVTTDICLKIEHVSNKYNVSFTDVMNRIMQIHTSWVDPMPKRRPVK